MVEHTEDKLRRALEDRLNNIFADATPNTAKHVELATWVVRNKGALLSALAATQEQPRDHPSEAIARLVLENEILRSKIATQEQRGEWQPIESAPKGDDDFFLVCGVGDPRSPFVVRGSILKNARRPDTPSHLHLHYLTHWQPLPALPAVSSSKLDAL